MSQATSARVWRANLQLSTETLAAAAPGLEALGLEPKEFFVLDAVEAQPYPAALATHLSMPKPTVTAYLKSLQGKGLLSRAVDANDLRRHRLELTPKGRKVVTQARNLLMAGYAERLVRLSKQEQGEFARLLEKLCE